MLQILGPVSDTDILDVGSHTVTGVDFPRLFNDCLTSLLTIAMALAGDAKWIFLKRGSSIAAAKKINLFPVGSVGFLLAFSVHFEVVWPKDPEQ